MADINNLIPAINNLVTAMGAAPAAAVAAPAGAPNPKISVQIPSFKEEPGENVVAWLLQVITIFAAQEINDEQTKIYYASTGLKEGALHWYLSRTLANNSNPPFATINEFEPAIKVAFQLPNYQQYLRQQLKRTRQFGTVQEYTSRFQNIVGQIEGMGTLTRPPTILMD